LYLWRQKKGDDVKGTGESRAPADNKEKVGERGNACKSGV